MPARQFTQAARTLDPAGDEVPAAQFKHVATEVAATVVEYVPARQLIHAEPAGEYMPARQFTQAARAVDPAGDDFPAAQLVHTAVPVDVLYVPCAHTVHVPPFGPVYPAMQIHAVEDVCPEDECAEFDGQAVHPCEPLDGLYVDAPHAEHVPPFGPV